MAAPVSIESLLRVSHAALPVVPGYRLRALLGRGGMGVVYAAVREGTEKLVAVKLLRSEIATSANLARFDRERRIQAGMHHPDIATLLDSGETADGTPFLVMEYVEGRPLPDYCEAGPLDLRARVRLFHRVCQVVAAAHDHGVIHRDLKPGNILVTDEGRPKLLDFGIAKLAATEEHLTVTGCRPLTPEYASTEQLRGGPATLASDVYSLGAILGELTGEANEQLTAICRRAMAERPEERYQHARALGEDLMAFLEGRPLSVQVRRPRMRWQAVVVALVLALLPTLQQHWAATETVPTASERDYLVARHLWSKLSVPELHRAERWFRMAVKEDPRSALAHAGLADALYYEGELEGGAPQVRFQEAKVEARRAIELNNRLPLAHAVLGSVLFASELKWPYAEAEFQLALKLDPKNVRAMQGYACMLTRLGRLEEAGFLTKRARQLDPASPILGLLEARIPFFARHFESARDQLQGVLDRDPSFSLAHYWLALCYRFLGQMSEAEAELRKTGLSERGMAVELAWIHGVTPNEWPALLAREKNSPNMVYVAAAAGKLDLAFELLDRAIDQRQTLALGLKTDPRFDPLRGDPRFEARLKRVGLSNLR